MTFILGSGLLLGLLGFIGRSLFLHYLEHDLEKFKRDLEVEAHNKRFVFSEVYKKRLDIIASLYGNSVEAGRAVSYAIGMQGNIKEEDIPELEQKVRRFKEEYENCRIWLDDSCCLALDCLIDEQSIFYKVVNAASISKSGLGKEWVGNAMLHLWEKAQHDLPTAQEQLRSAFRATIHNIET